MTEQEHDLVAPFNHIKLLRGEIRFEHHLLNNRLSAMLAAQSFLLAAFALAATRDSPQHSHFLWFWYGVIPVVGLVVALLAMVAVAAGKRRLVSLHALLYDDGNSLGKLANKVCPPLDANTQSKSLLYAWVLPAVFVIAWSCGAVAGIGRLAGVM